jgi:hypothetical protein
MTDTNTDTDLSEQIAALERRFKAIEDDPVMRLVSAMARKSKANLRDRYRYIAAANEKDPFMRLVKKPFVFPEELR